MGWVGRQSFALNGGLREYGVVRDRCTGHRQSRLITGSLGKGISITLQASALRSYPEAVTIELRINKENICKFFEMLKFQLIDQIVL